MKKQISQSIVLASLLGIGGLADAHTGNKPLSMTLPAKAAGHGPHKAHTHKAHTHKEHAHKEHAHKTAPAPKKEKPAAGKKSNPVASPSDLSCGYSVEAGTRNVTPAGYNAWTTIKNVSGAPASSFKVFLDLGGSTLRNGMQAEFTQVDGGYEVTEPNRLARNPIRAGDDFTFSFLGSVPYVGIKPYLISVNGVNCDTTAPDVSLSADHTLFTAPGTLTLSASASDDVAIKKVVFKQNGQVIGEKTSAPFTLDVNISSADNGRNIFTATAYDITGNEATSESFRVLAAINNRFLGTAPGSNADFVHAATYFNQITPEDASKWGSVEATRGVMNWAGLDQAYQFAKQNGFPFKLHTLIWGQQAPSWMDSLSPEEQLAEIEEWMALLAERYPDVEMIDVVNEPLHAPPTFTEALGGAGETGWDWVVTSFELARRYFPNAELLINDYQILIMQQFADDYLEVITPLIERNLIDGIGVQAHFLERADTAEVAASLAKLTATGLPVYVSEFDLNIANDALHANRMRDLVTVFYNNPSVVGLTHWGHLQGDVWRENGYLIRQDGSHRPGFDWLLCYHAGGGDSCTVPEYVPVGWNGSANGLVLQAEEYDEGEGIVALGDVIAYVDTGDWISYKRVNFRDDWNTLSIAYANGGGSAGTVSFHLGSPEAPATLTVPLAPTGSWGVTKTHEVSWAPITGEHDVYIKFTGAYGVGNIDSFTFHPPVSDPGYGPNLVTNPGFESGHTNGWFSWDGQISATTAMAHTGNYSLLLSNRSGNGPAVYSLQGVVNPGSTYDVSMYVSIGGSASADVNVTSKLGCAGNDSYSWLINPVSIQEGEWVKLSGQLSIPEDCALSDMLIYAEGPAGGIDIYLDDVSVRQLPAENVMPNGSFEAGHTSGWFSWSGSVGISSSHTSHGMYSLVVNNRPGNGPAAYEMLPLLTQGQSYNVSMDVSIMGAASAPANITRKIVCDGNAEYGWLANTGAIAEGEWVTLSGVLEVPVCNLTEVLIYVEGPDAGIDLYVDNVQVTRQ